MHMQLIEIQMVNQNCKTGVEPVSRTCGTTPFGFQKN